MANEDLGTLLDALRRDPFRDEHPFSEDLRDAHAVLHHPFATFDERVEVLKRWFLKRQPCNFGRMAGKYGFVHFCILTERELMAGDKVVAAKISEEKRLWKQKAFDDRRNPPHAFMLVIASPRVALAAPDGELRRFAEGIRDLAGFRPARRASLENAVSSDLLYLRHPTDGNCYGFQFNLDFFASAGDGRWWHDHRVPGGIAFTANNTGHMRAWQEWYSEDRGQDRSEFFVKNAMYTIAQAHASHGAATERPEGSPADPLAEGRVTWLRDLVDDKPMKDVACPFATGAPDRLAGKDWSTYEGLLHTDHAVRREFFEESSQPPTRSRPYLMDFTYLYDKREQDYVRFTAGVRLAEREVYAVIGDPTNWTRTTRAGNSTEPAVERSAEAETEIKQSLDACMRWSDAPELVSPVRL